MAGFARALAALAAVALLGAIAAGALGGSNPNKLRADLSGGPGADPDGVGTAFVSLQPNRRRICFRIAYRRIAKPDRGHIHEAPKGAKGSILIDLFVGPRPGGSPITGCVRYLRRGTITQIRRNPHRYFVELHNTRLLGGAIRGRLHRR